MTDLSFSKKEFLDAAIKEDDFTHLSKTGFELGAETFLTSIYEDAKENDFLNYSCEELLELAQNFWMFGNRRVPGEILIDVKPSPLPRKTGQPLTMVQVIIDNMAFTVDSLVGAVASLGVDVFGLFHPVVSGKRDADGRWHKDGEDVKESMILLLVASQTQTNMGVLKREVSRTLTEVSTVTSDFVPMVQAIRACAVELEHAPTRVDAADLKECVEFLDWLAGGNFVLFGVRRYQFEADKTGQVDYVKPRVIEDASLGVLKDTDLAVLRQSSEPTVIAKNVERFLNEGLPVTVAKSNLFTRVHRRVRMDYISVKHFDKSGQVNGETRFVGLFTAEAYNRSPHFVPLLRSKVEKVKVRSGWDANSHNGKRLDFVLSSYPRDELFQIEEDDLLRIATGVAQAFDRPRTRLFVRRDNFERFVSVLVYVPQEHYNARVRERIGERLKTAFGGRISAFYPQYSDAALARVHFIIGLNPDEGEHPDLDALEQELADLSQPWFEGVRLAADSHETSQDPNVLQLYTQAFSVSYQDIFTPLEGLSDIHVCESLSDASPFAARVQDMSGLPDGRFRVKLYSRELRLEPSDIIPVLTNFNCHAIVESAYEVYRSDGTTFWINDIQIRLPYGLEEHEDFASVFETAFEATWCGDNEDDGFNRLILAQSANWRDIAFLRLVARYRRQSGLDPSEATQIEALQSAPELTKHLIELKHAKFDPEAYDSKSKRETAVESLLEDIETGLKDVSSLDHDRVIRRMAQVIEHSLRTNFYQTQDDGQVKAYISLKIDSQKIECLPAPKPYREIYVSSPMVEGVHLRFGPIARGGLRWSDRRDDFRTEVLGLVKAQQVKNAVIVPVGSKGGFYPKHLPKGGSRSEIQDAAIEAYKVFISALLDLTDNYKGEDTIPPENVICWDAPDPYLVVAADKGTATFSDIANGISQDYGFWLDDAFASGGSAGYDHKAMGITARGAWEAVKRHFREIGKNIQTEPFTAIGVGDMSGDVFGNGMLLSEQTQLVAAFNHLHIFIDPEPDVSKSFKERKRLFEMPRSGWDDYNTKLISKGGGVFARDAKSITLTDEIRALTGLKDEEVTPNALIYALLRAEVELLWFGGIGTYVKSSQESHFQAGDKANDPIRVDGAELRVSVIGEGANLGMTQAARIEFARAGGRLNTDAIDNSAGVDSSDNEVNIKILLGGAIESGALKQSDRNELLAEMTDDVAELVLQHNYDQTRMISVCEMRAERDINAYERLMCTLEADGLLDRTVEGLPNSDNMKSLEAKNKGLTRPEIAVLAAYVKNRMFDDLIDTDVADDDFMEQALCAYFPDALDKFDAAREGHRLKREIIISRLVNQIVDVCGPLFMMRLEEQTQGRKDAIAKAFIVAFETLQVAKLIENISALDNEVDATAQLQLMDEIASVIQRVVAWMVRRNEEGVLTDRIAQRKDISDVVDSAWLELLSPYDKRRAESRIRGFVKSGIPEDLATDVALLRSRASGYDVLTLKTATGWSLTEAAELFYDIGARFKIDRIRAALLVTRSEGHWERMALRHLQEDFFNTQGEFAEHAAAWKATQDNSADMDVAELIQAWSKEHVPRLKAYENTVTAMTRSGDWTVSKFAIINAQLSDLKSGLKPL